LELEINGQPFAIGVSDADVEIPSYGTQLLPLHVYASVFDIIKSVQGLQKNQEQLKYQIVYLFGDYTSEILEVF
jgi:hypothetical protein